MGNIEGNNKNRKKEREGGREKKQIEINGE